MALIINKPPAPPEPPANIHISERIKLQQKETPLPISDSQDHHLLVVDGKAKKVSKRSTYLLDMMTVDE